jgi:hypothetical protein
MAPRFEARDYLEHVLPALIGATSLPPMKDETIIQVVVADVDGLDLFYTIARGSVSVTRGICGRFDLMLTFMRSAVEELAADELSVLRAMRSARLKVRGDEEVLAWLAKRLAA